MEKKHPNLLTFGFIRNVNNINDENNENDENTVYEMLGYLTTTLITSCLTYSILCIL